MSQICVCFYPLEPLESPTSMSLFLLQTCFDDIKRRLSFTSAEQRSALKVCEDNIHTDFVYEVGIMFQEDQYETADRYVEITYVAHVVQVS